jgi:hypothetical protein
MSTFREDDQGLLHDYLGSEPLPTDHAIIKAEIERTVAVTEMEIGFLNAMYADPKTKLNEQGRVYELPLLRWVLKAIRERDRGFFTRLNKALAIADYCCPHTQVPREMIQAASTRSRELGRRSAAKLEKLRALQHDPEWLFQATDEDFQRVLNELRHECLRTMNTSEPDLLLPTKKEHIAEWEDRTGRKQSEIDVKRERKAARLSNLPQMRPGRPRGLKKRSGG